jgi:hypothetical protein
VRVSHFARLSYDDKGQTIAVGIPDEVIKIIGLLLVTAIEIGDGEPPARRKRP